MLTPKEQLPIICKGLFQLINKEELLLKLEHSYQTNTPLIAKLGLDPSAPDIHLGHTVVLRKLKQLQDLGHIVVIVIGDFTGRIGDPTGKSKARSALSEKQVRENAATYCEQIFKILDKKKTMVRFNSEWLSSLSLEKFLSVASTITVARMLEREEFQNRYQKQLPIGLHEFFYPLMQAYDSVFLKADIELGGTDQTFNILMGRMLQKAFGLEQQIAMFLPILEGLDGIEKMSKSLGNYIGIQEPAQVMFKKVMEIPDNLIIRYYELTTDEHPDIILQVKKRLEAGENPRNIKYELAQIITSLYYTDLEVQQAEQYYNAAFQKKGIPDNIPELLIDWETDTIYDIIPKLIQLNLIKSKSEFIRLIKQGGICLEGERLSSSDDLSLVISNQDVMKIGKKKFIRFIK